MLLHLLKTDQVSGSAITLTISLFSKLTGLSKVNVLFGGTSKLLYDKM